MKIWFFARYKKTGEYLYIKVKNNTTKEISLDTQKVENLPMYKVTKHRFNEIIKQYGNIVYHTNIIIRGTKFCFQEENGIDLMEKHFIRDEYLLKLPVVPMEVSKIEILKICNENWKKNTTTF